MNILLTNDDGIGAPGIWAAARALVGMGNVLVVAPASDYSGYGAALPPARELGYHPYRVPDGLPRVAAFAVTGTPATCVQVGLSGAFSKRRIDLVVSGINNGLNTGRDVCYSGTVGAALTAHLMGVPALAASLDGGECGVLHWDTAGWALREFLQTCSSRQENTPLFFNLNVPNLASSDLAGVVMTSLSRASCLARYTIRVASERTLVVQQRDDPASGQPEHGTDAWAVARGYVSITPLKVFPDLLYVAPWGEAAGAIPVSLAQTALVG